MKGVHLLTICNLILSVVGTSNVVTDNGKLRKQRSDVMDNNVAISVINLLEHEKDHNTDEVINITKESWKSRSHRNKKNDNMMGRNDTNGDKEQISLIKTYVEEKALNAGINNVRQLRGRILSEVPSSAPSFSPSSSPSFSPSSSPTLYPTTSPSAI